MHHLLKDNIECIQQGVRLLRHVSTGDFTHRLEACFHSSIGGHLRHNIDHYLRFRDGLAAGRIDYDSRERDERIETDAEYATDKLQEVAGFLAGIPVDALEKPVQVKMDSGTRVGESESEAWVKSSVGRELQFLLSHSVHHYALIAVICNLLDVQLEDGFGYAPSTLKHREKIETRECVL